jgi:hypothetical protein
MPVKLIQYFNILQGCKQDFDTFFTGEFVPQIGYTGHMKIVGSWQVASGEGPCFIVEGISNAADDMEKLIMSPEYQKLRLRLFQFVGDYSTKLLAPTGHIEARLVEIEQGYKFNQHFNINAADYYEYISFSENDHIPTMQNFGITIVGRWSVIVGATPYVISEGRAEDLATIGEMLENPQYHKLTLKLLKMVSSYGCKVLVPSGHLNK